MTTATYQTERPATMPAGLEVETEDINGAKRQAVAVHMNGAGDPLVSKIIDNDGHIANVQAVTVQIAGDEYGVVTNAIIHGKTSQGNWVDVKATPSGALTVESTVAAIDEGVEFATTRADDFYNDAFQRLRVSDTDQRFDAEFIYDKQPLLFDEITAGAGTATHNAASRDVTLAVGSTAAASAAGLYQHWSNPYTPGNSQFIAITGALNAANVAGGTAAVFLRTSVTGSVAEEVIPQAQWEAATTGVEWRYSQIMLMDFQSLKVGRIRFALDRAGLAVKIAEIANDNEKPGGYWQMANAPTFWRVYNSSDSSISEFGYGDEANAIGFRYTVPLDASFTARAICVTVKSEGGGNLLEMAGLPFTASNGATTKTVSSTLIPLLSVQNKTTFNSLPSHGLAIATGLSFLNDNPIYYEVRRNATLTNASFASVSNNSIMNFDVAATAVTGGEVIASGYAGAGGTRASASERGLGDKLPLSVNYAGTTGDILTVCAVRVGTTNAATGAALEWREIR